MFIKSLSFWAKFHPVKARWLIFFFTNTFGFSEDVKKVSSFHQSLPELQKHTLFRILRKKQPNAAFSTTNVLVKEYKKKFRGNPLKFLLAAILSLAFFVGLFLLFTWLFPNLIRILSLLIVILIYFGIEYLITEIIDKKNKI